MPPQFCAFEASLLAQLVHGGQPFGLLQRPGRIAVKWSVETPNHWISLDGGTSPRTIGSSTHISSFVFICQTQQWMAHFTEEVMATMELRFFGELLQEEEQEHCHVRLSPEI